MRRRDDAPRDDPPPEHGSGARRLAVACLTAGLLVASTGGVLAAVGVRPTGSAAVAQYGVPPTQPPVTVPPPASTGPTATTPVNPAPAPITTTPIAEETSKHKLKIHIDVPHNAKLRKVTVEVNGKIISVLRGKKASANLNLGHLPCGKGTTTVVVTAVTTSGKIVRQTHKYHLC
jgi:hypothetical protein